MKCTNCEGLGWYPDHDDGCTGSSGCNGCPIQRECGACGTLGIDLEWDWDGSPF
jgi:hypothetical protein